MTKPTCPLCGGPMECVVRSGQELDPDTGKWVPSRRESWRCIRAVNDRNDARRVFERQLQERYGNHLRPITITRPDKAVVSGAGES